MCDSHLAQILTIATNDDIPFPPTIESLVNSKVIVKKLLSVAERGSD